MADFSVPPLCPACKTWHSANAACACLKCRRHHPSRVTCDAFALSLPTYEVPSHAPEEDCEEDHEALAEADTDRFDWRAWSEEHFPSPAPPAPPGEETIVGLLRRREQPRDTAEDGGPPSATDEGEDPQVG